MSPYIFRHGSPPVPASRSAGLRSRRKGRREMPENKLCALCDSAVGSFFRNVTFHV
jgi:hypothetical protein